MRDNSTCNEENREHKELGDGNGPGNMKGINIEICYSLSGGERFDKAEKRAAQFIAEILKRYGWGIDKVTKHQDYNGKYCPHRTLNNGWQRFLDMVKAYLDDAEADEVKWLFDANSNKWCAKKNGQWLYGWILDKDKWYYIGEDGYMTTGWAKVKDEWYYLKPDSPDSGRMLTGWLWDKNYNACTT
jgi:glucan-binding YG repeat protein